MQRFSLIFAALFVNVFTWAILPTDIIKRVCVSFGGIYQRATRNIAPIIQLAQEQNELFCWYGYLIMILPKNWTKF